MFIEQLLHAGPRTTGPSWSSPHRVYNLVTEETVGKPSCNMPGAKSALERERAGAGLLWCSRLGDKVILEQRPEGGQGVRPACLRAMRVSGWRGGWGGRGRRLVPASEGEWSENREGRWVQSVEALPSTVRTSEFSRLGKALESLKDRRVLQFMGLLWLLSVILGV